MKATEAAKAIMDNVRRYVDARFDQLASRVASIELAAGPVGPAGKDGTGILDAKLVGESLVLRMTDGSERNVGRVVGAPGEDAVARDGKDGRGIAGARLIDGGLNLVFTDGTVQDVGRVVGERGAPGEPGRGERGPAGERGRSVEVTLGRAAPKNPEPGDMWIVP